MDDSDSICVSLGVRVRRSTPVHAEPRNRGGLKAVDDATKPFPKCGSAEVDQQSHLSIRELEIGQDLLGMLTTELLNAFDLHYNSILHDEVCPKSFLEDHALVFETNHLLSLHAEPP